MATAAVTYAILNGSATDGAKVNQNFTDLVNFLNNSVVHRDGSKTLTAPLDMNTQKIVNLGTPTVATDGATKGYVDGIVSALDSVGYAIRTTDISLGVSASSDIIVETETLDYLNWFTVASQVWTCPTTGLYFMSVACTKGSGTGTATPSLVQTSGTAVQAGQFTTVASSSAGVPGYTAGFLYVTAGATFKGVVTSGPASVVVDRCDMFVARLR